MRRFKRIMRVLGGFLCLLLIGYFIYTGVNP